MNIWSLYIVKTSDAYLEPCQTSKMELSTKNLTAKHCYDAITSLLNIKSDHIFVSS